MTKRAAADEAGYTLSEVLIAVVILSVAITALLGSLSSVLFTSRANRNIATADSAVRAFAEQIVAASYQTCAPLTGPGSYGNNGAMVNPPSGFSVTITKIEYGDALSSSGGTQTFSTTNQGACIAAGDAGVERITIVATPVSGPGAATLQIVKRNPIETS